MITCPGVVQDATGARSRWRYTVVRATPRMPAISVIVRPSASSRRPVSIFAVAVTGGRPSSARGAARAQTQPATRTRATTAGPRQWWCRSTRSAAGTHSPAVEVGDGVNQIAQGAAEAIQPPDDQDVAGAQPVGQLRPAGLRPDAVSVKVRQQPAAASASCCSAGFCSGVETRAWPRGCPMPANVAKPTDHRTAPPKYRTRVKDTPGPACRRPPADVDNRAFPERTPGSCAGGVRSSRARTAATALLVHVGKRSLTVGCCSGGPRCRRDRR